MNYIKTGTNVFYIKYLCDVIMGMGCKNEDIKKAASGEKRL